MKILLMAKKFAIFAVEKTKWYDTIYNIHIPIQAHQRTDGERFVSARHQCGGFDERQADDEQIEQKYLFHRFTFCFKTYAHICRERRAGKSFKKK